MVSKLQVQSRITQLLSPKENDHSHVPHVLAELAKSRLG